MKTKFTFKTVQPTGPYRSFYEPEHLIKIGGRVCGTIDEKNKKIRLMVIKEDINENGNPNCIWKNVTLKYQPTSLQDAKQFLNRNFSAITANFKLFTKEE